MAKWLIKSEPSAYSFEQLQKDKTTRWDGIRSYASRLHLMAMKKNDMLLFYHSNEGLEITGTAKVSKTAFPDPTSDDDKWVAIEIAAVKKLNKPVTLKQVKADKLLSGMALVKISRLSVAPVTEEEWERVMELSK